MNKKLVAALVAGAFVAPLAQAAEGSNVTLYGIAQVAFSHWDNGSSTKKHGLEDTGSRIGFKGEEVLGGGMKAFFQIESSASLDQGGGTFASREGWVGLKGGFGGVQLGRGKSLFDLAQEAFDPFNSNSTLINALQVDGTYYRVNNTIRYTLPAFAGFSGGVEYGDMEGKGTQGTQGVKPAFYSASLRYENGPLFVQTGYEHLKEVSGGPQTETAGAIPGLKGDSYIIGAGYTLPFGLGLQAAYRHMERKVNGAPYGISGTAKIKRDTFLANAQQSFGPVTLKLGFVQAGNLKGCGDSCSTDTIAADGTQYNVTKGARWYTAAAEYAFSKRTWVYLEHATADNKSNSGLFKTSAGSVAVDTVGGVGLGGKDNKTTSLGIIHLF